jgi:FkbM family methyltransferase
VKTAIAIYKLKLESPCEIFVHRINKIFHGKIKANEIKYFKNPKKLRKKHFKNGLWNFKGIILPDYKPDEVGWSINHVYKDTLFVYCMHKDNYDSSFIDKLDEFLPEGTYCYRNIDIDVTVKENDIVIDAGAWIGDFSAYASIKGAKVYAFEPSKDNFKYLSKTQELNKNIHIIRKGLGDKPGVSYITNITGNAASNHITTDIAGSEKIEMTTIDLFVSEHQLLRVDFIKADIEGYERYMLIGAKETLRKFGPKLAICTYHTSDDPEILKQIILNANPKYIIVQKRKKLYAMLKQ